MMFFVRLIRPMRIALWVATAAFFLWWAWMLFHGSTNPLLLWAPFIWMGVFLFDRALAELDPYTARARRRRTQKAPETNYLLDDKDWNR